MILKYTEFLLENMDLSKSIINKKMESYEKLKDLLKKNLGYIGKFTEYLFHENVEFDELEKVYNEILNLKKMNHQININNLTFEKLLDEIQSSEEIVKINRLISRFPPTQKKIVKSNIEIKKLYSNLLKLSDKENLNVFLSKISRYKDISSISKAIRIFLKNTDNTIENVKKTIENDTKSKIVYDKNGLLIVYIPYQKDVQTLGSDTSWCIVNSKSMWTSYTGGKNKKQYILYDYNVDDLNPLFKIGITMNNGTISNAHDTLDNNSMEYVRKLFNENNINTNSIFSQSYLKGNDIYKIGSLVQHQTHGIGKIISINGDSIRVKKNRTHSGMGEYYSNRESLKPYVRLSSSTSKTKWLETIPSLSKEESISYVNRVLNWTKTDLYKKELVKNLIDNIVKKEDYIDSKDVLSYFDEKVKKDFILKNSIYNNKKILNRDMIKTPYFSVVNYITPLLDGYWSDEEIIYYSNTIKYLNNDIQIKQIYEKLESVYNKGIKVENNYNPKFSSYKEGIHLNRNFELNLVVISKKLDLKPKGLFKSNYDKIVKQQSNRLKEFPELFNIPLDYKEDKYLIKRMIHTQNSPRLSSEEISNRIIIKDYHDIYYRYPYDNDSNLFYNEMDTIDMINKKINDEGFSVSFSVGKHAIPPIRRNKTDSKFLNLLLNLYENDLRKNMKKDVIVGDSMLSIRYNKT